MLPPNAITVDGSAQVLAVEKFGALDLNDPFFSSLKADYGKFESWFKSKQSNDAFVFYKSERAGLDGFLYLKVEDGPVLDVSPQMPSARRLKVGTFKINPHGTRLGERFLKRAFDTAIEEKVVALYVTIFEKHIALVQLFKRYGFRKVAEKNTEDGTELVLERRLDEFVEDVVLDYPRIPLRKGRHFVLSIYPEWHSRLLPDSLLTTESVSILQDVSHTNSIHKIYLTRMRGVDALQEKDTLLIYRTQDGGAAYYTSVITTVGVVEEVRELRSFATEEEFYQYCSPYSVFTTEELRRFYQEGKYPWLIRFTYNMALTKRVNRKLLLEEVGLSANQYWGFFPVTTNQFKKIVELSGDYEKTRSLVYSS